MDAPNWNQVSQNQTANRSVTRTTSMNHDFPPAERSNPERYQSLIIDESTTTVT